MNVQTNKMRHSDTWATKDSTIVVAFILGMAIITLSIVLGRSHVMYISVAAVALLMTLIWRNTPRSWIYLVSIAAAIPVPLFRQQVAPNLLFAVCFIALNVRYLSKLPKWLYVMNALLIMGYLTSSFNWFSGDIVGSIMRQSAYFFNFGLAPLLLVPMIYVRLSESRNFKANLQGLLFCLIMPSTFLLIVTKVFGIQINVWEASLHVEAGAEGYIKYQIGKALIDFTRTGVGFILATMICAAAAIASAPVKANYRLLAGGCLAINIYLLLVTGSFGSMAASLCGLSAIFYAQLRTIKITQVLLPIIAIGCMILLIFAFTPQSTKVYLEKRFEHRIVKTDTDRLTLWDRAFDYFLAHPGGVGLTYTVGEKKKSNPHNEYLVYLVSYGLLGGIAYLASVIGLLISFFIKKKRLIDEPFAYAVYLAGLGVIVAVAINSMTDNIGVNRWYFNIIWSIIWYCYFCTQAAKKTRLTEGDSIRKRESMTKTKY